VPFTVVVTTLVAVVRAVHPAHVVQGAFVLHGPAVQPGQSDAGQAAPFHHEVQGPRQSSEWVDHQGAEKGGPPESRSLVSNLESGNGGDGK
jgi:hypothetical protein